MCTMIWVNISVKAGTLGDWCGGLSADPKSFHWNHRSPQTPANCQAFQNLNLLLWVGWNGKKECKKTKGHFLIYFYFYGGKHDFILIPLQTRTPSSLILDQNYINTKNQVIKAERRVLKELGFCVHVKHPHKVSETTLAFNRKLNLCRGCNHSGIRKIWLKLCVSKDLIVWFQIIVMYMQVLECEKNQTLVQTAW